MTASNSNEQVVFDSRTLRLIIGALAFAFPSAVIALTGKITTSISASYHELETRDIFVGFLFVIGALLISYRGHIQEENGKEPGTFWERFREMIRRYQEDVVSTIGGIAAILTALFPTACDGCAMDGKAAIHTIGAFVLFSNVVYFCLIAFLRSLNQKLLDYAALKENSEFVDHVNAIRNDKSRDDVNLLQKFWNFLTLEGQIFLAIAAEQSRKYDRENRVMKIVKLLLVHGKKFARGYVYLVCGALIALTLLTFILLLLVMPGSVAGSNTTFVVETIALVLFGFAWMTASKMEYFAQIESWWQSRSEQTTAATEPGVA